MTFMQPLELVEPEEQAMHQATDAAARASGTPFISYYAPDEVLAMARDAGFTTARPVTAADYAQRYFADRTVAPAFTTEELLVATTSRRRAARAALRQRFRCPALGPSSGSSSSTTKCAAVSNRKIIPWAGPISRRSGSKPFFVHSTPTGSAGRYGRSPTTG